MTLTFWPFWLVCLCWAVLLVWLIVPIFFGDKNDE